MEPEGRTIHMLATCVLVCAALHVGAARLLLPEFVAAEP